ncbi:hypothetical protein HYS82_01070 [Candidatus Amesbacteria bacterium]|nr:hypothetical protein [Candidatus Amesbacteria bacterium]MBI2587295.1 hypothetical protein [Candidatus Amesbacteria bacterium]
MPNLGSQSKRKLREARKICEEGGLTLVTEEEAKKADKVRRRLGEKTLAELMAEREALKNGSRTQERK